MPENSKPASYNLSSMPVARFPTSRMEPLVSSESQMFVFFPLENESGFRGGEQLRSFSIEGQLLQLDHGMVPIWEDQEDTCQIGLFIMIEQEKVLGTLLDFKIQDSESWL